MCVDSTIFRLSDSGREEPSGVRSPRRRAALSGLPRREAGRPSYASQAARRYAEAKHRLDGCWRASMAPKARSFSAATFRRVQADMLREGLLERKRSQDRGNRRTYVLRRRGPPTERPAKKRSLEAGRGWTPQSRAQNSTPVYPIRSAGNQKQYGGPQATLSFSKGSPSQPPGKPLKSGFPAKIRGLAFALVHHGCSSLFEGQPVRIPSLAHAHYDNCKVCFTRRTAWNYAAKALQDGHPTARIAAAYHKAVMYCHRLATDRGVKMSPALSVWLARKDLAQDGKIPTQRRAEIRAREQNYREHVARLLGKEAVKVPVLDPHAPPRGHGPSPGPGSVQSPFGGVAVAGGKVFVPAVAAPRSVFSGTLPG